MHNWHVLSPTVAVHLPMTLCGGQCFRWRQTVRGTWVGVVERGAYELCESPQLPGNCVDHRHRTQHTGAGSFMSSNSESSKDVLWFRCLHRELKTVLDITSEASFLHYYLALDVDLQQLWRRWTVNNPMCKHPLVRYFALNATREPSVSIRVLRQELHETLFAFICSQNNNVQRITGLVEKMAISFGRHICDYNLVTGEVKSMDFMHSNTTRDTNCKRHIDQEEGEWIPLHSLPTVEELGTKTEGDLRALGFGYRSKYIIDSATIILSSGVTKRAEKEGKSGSIEYVYKWYSELLNPRLTLCERRKKLQSLPGVGRKVSDCILLFSVGHHELVPVDTHMAQIAAKYLTQPVTSETESLCNGIKGNRKRAREGTVNLTEDGMDGLWWEKILVEWYKKGKEGGKNMPVLLPKHHDAIQLAFQHLFGDWCGWAHSILFYARLTREKQKR